MIVFGPLQMDQRNDVARIQVLELTEQLLSQALGLSLTEQALDVLVREGFDPPLWCSTNAACDPEAAGASTG